MKSRKRANRGTRDLVRLLRDGNTAPEEMPDEAYDWIDEFDQEAERVRVPRRREEEMR